jgi:hypothetical protein
MRMAECAVLALPPRWVPRWLWAATVSTFYLDDGVKLHEIPWSTRSQVELPDHGGTIRLYYTAPNELWMRKANVDAEALDGRLVVYRARLLPFLRPHVEVVEHPAT